MTKQLNEVQMTWITVFADELGRLLRGHSTEDCLSRTVVNVLVQIDRYMRQFPKPCDAAKAMHFTCKVDFKRDEAKQRGEGVRHSRVVGQLTRVSDDTGVITEFDIADKSAIDPATQAADRDECRRAVNQLRPVVATGVALTAVFGLNQAEAADEIGVTREYLSRQMKQSEREMQRATKPAA